MTRAFCWLLPFGLGLLSLASGCASAVQAGHNTALDATDLVQMTDDMSLPSADRKRHQAQRAPGLSARAKCIKLADKIANVGDIGSQPPPDWSLERRRTYFAWTAEVINGCRGVNEGLERRYDEVLKEAQRVTG